MNSDSSYLTDLAIKVGKGNNRLLDIITKASQKDIYIESVKTVEEETDTIYYLTVKTSDADRLELFINDLKSLSFLIDVTRVHR